MPRLKTTGKIHDTLTGYDFRADKPLIRSKAIRQKCIECQCGQLAEIRRCQIYDCTLWPWRMGRKLRSDEKTLPGRDSESNAPSDDTESDPLHLSEEYAV